MTKDLDTSLAISRRSMLGAIGTAAGAAVAATPSLSLAAELLHASESRRFVRELGSRDLRCSAPGLKWSDFDGGSITITMKTSGRPVRLSARVPLEYGGPEGSGVGISFAENGIDLHQPSELGLAYARIDAGTVVSTTLETAAVRQIPAGIHHWTLRVRHENSTAGLEMPCLYCRTQRVAPLEFSAVEL